MQASRGKVFINRILSHPHRVLASIFLIGFSILALILPLLPLDPEGLDVIHSLTKPSMQHFFGTDEVGRDYFARVLYGGRVSLMVGFLSMAMSIGLGVMIGLISGYFGGVADFFFMRLVDVLSSIPWMILVMVFGMVFGRGLFSLVMVIGLLSWMETARIIRGEVLSLKEREYVLYARFLGIFPLRILFSHIFPGILPTIITASTAAIASSIMVESALSFLGRGVTAPMSSWGSLLQNAQKFLQKAPHMAILPGILIIITVLSFHQWGEALRESLLLERE